MKMLISCSSKDPQISMMRTFFMTTSEGNNILIPSPADNAIVAIEPSAENQSLADLVNYPPDISSEESKDDSDTDDDWDNLAEDMRGDEGRLAAVPP
jgi:hypothetical protein